MTVDGIWSLIGSSNWDVRSFRLNFELDLEVYDPMVAQQIDALISAQQGRRVSAAQLNARSLPVRIRDGAARLMLPYL
jgi:cardiolipin synthase